MLPGHFLPRSRWKLSGSNKDEGSAATEPLCLIVVLHAGGGSNPRPCSRSPCVLHQVTQRLAAGDLAGALRATPVRQPLVSCRLLALRTRCCCKFLRGSQSRLPASSTSRCGTDRFMQRLSPDVSPRCEREGSRRPAEFHHRKQSPDCGPVQSLCDRSCSKRRGLHEACRRSPRCP